MIRNRSHDRRHAPTSRSSCARNPRRFRGLFLEPLEARNLLAAFPPADMVSWYRAEGDALDFADGNHGTMENGATFAGGEVGQAFSFDGVDDQIAVPHQANQNTGSQLTIEAWVNPSTLDHGRPIAQKRSSGNVGGFTFETTHSSIPGEPANGLQFVLWLGSTPTFARVATPPNVLATGVWQHVAATYDGAAMKIYVNGIEQASLAVSGTIHATTDPLVIGRNVVIPSFAWDGLIDEVTIYSRALSPAEIQSIVSAGSDGKDIDPAIIYSQDFEGTFGTEWSSTQTDVTPVGERRFLGQFGNDSVTLTLPAALFPAETTTVALSFDLFAIRTWDGNHDGGGSGPDRFGLSLGGTPLLDTTFSNGHPNSAFAGQAYPGSFGTGQFDPRTGADENNTLGFTFPGVDVMDSVYNLDFTFPYAGGDVVLTFTGLLTTPGFDESWGLDNVRVAVDAKPDSGPPPVFQFSAPQYEVVEGQEFAVLRVERTGGLNQSARVDFETIDSTAAASSLRTTRLLSDYATSSGTLVFRSHQNVAQLKIPIRDDSRIEPDEEFQVVLSNPSAGFELGEVSTAEVVIHDNDPNVSFLAPSSNKGEVAGRSLLEVRLTPASNQTVTVAYAAVGGSATFGQDFRPQSGTLTFRPGDTRKFVPLDIIPDANYEGNETVIFELTSATNAFLGANTRHRVTIVDNDPQPPPHEPGSTFADALFVDLKTLPRQSQLQLFVPGDIDTFRVHLHAGEMLGLDVDPVQFGSPPVVFPGLQSSTLVIFGDDEQELARIGRSREPDTGAFTNNPATLFRAEVEGDYFIQLTTPQAVAGYRLHFHRLGVSETVPSPELLNVAGPMFAWFDGDDTVGITGPTGYGFTLVGNWQQTPLFNRRAGTWSQTLTLPAGSQFTLASPQGVALPLVANGVISIATNAGAWGRNVGVVTAPAINFPVALGIASINDLLAEAFGSEILAFGLLSGNWRISLGGKVLAVAGQNKNSEIGQLLAGVPYLRQKGPINVNAQLGPYSLNYSVIAKPIDWAFDPGDPMLYLKAEELGQVKQPALALSMHGLLEFKPQDAPHPLIDPGVTEFFGHVYATATIPFKIGPLPLEVDADVVVNVDADRDGLLLGDLRDVDELFDVLEGDFSEVREIVNDVQVGANGKLKAIIKVNEREFRTELGRASVVLDGLAETIWVRGQQGGTNPLAGTPLEGINTSSTIVVEGLINWDGDFLLSTTTSYKQAGVDFVYNITIADEGISAHVIGTAKWSATIDYGIGTVSGTAKATIEADIAIEIDDDGDIHLSGSITASGKLTAKIAGNNKTLFSGSIDASVRSKGFRFRFPRGVGNIDLDLFN